MDTILSGLYPAYGLYPFGWTPKGDEIVLNATTDRHREAITWLRDLYSEELLDKEYAVTSNKQWEEKMVTRAGVKMPIKEPHNLMKNVISLQATYVRRFHTGGP